MSAHSKLDSKAIAIKLLELSFETPELNDFLKLLKDLKGSDLHLSQGSKAMIRVRNTMYPMQKIGVNENIIQSICDDVLNEENSERLEKTGAVDFSIQHDEYGVFRFNVFRQRLGTTIVIRFLAAAPPSLKSLKMPSILARCLDFPNGLILVTGPTGSGKSTTLAAMLDHLNRKKRGHIITLEDPIEYVHTTKKCMINQRAYNKDFYDYSEAISQALREDPDYILVGEMRDLKTINAAIKAAETGHLVFSTLHTNSAAKTVDRILGAFPAGEQNEIRMMLSETLRMVVSQKLIASSDGTRLQAFQDILINNKAVQNLIREGKTHQIENIMATSKQDGMQLMDKRIREAAEQGDIRMADAKEKISDKKLLEEADRFISNQPLIKSIAESAIDEVDNEDYDEEFNYEDEIDNPYDNSIKYDHSEKIKVGSNQGSNPTNGANNSNETGKVKLNKNHPSGKTGKNGVQIDEEKAPLIGLKDLVSELAEQRKTQQKRKKAEVAVEVKNGKNKSMGDAKPPPPPKKGPRGIEIEFDKIINKTYGFDQIPEKKNSLVILNFENVRHITDEGMDNLLYFVANNIKTFKNKVKIKDVHTTIIELFQKSEFPKVFKNLLLESIHVNYYCGECDLTLYSKMEYGKDFHSDKDPEFPKEITCSECNSPARLNIDEDEVADFVKAA